MLQTCLDRVLRVWVPLHAVTSRVGVGRNFGRTRTVGAFRQIGCAEASSEHGPLHEERPWDVRCMIASIRERHGVECALGGQSPHRLWRSRHLRTPPTPRSKQRSLGHKNGLPMIAGDHHAGSKPSKPSRHPSSPTNCLRLGSWHTRCCFSCNQSSTHQTSPPGSADAPPMCCRRAVRS